MLVRYQQYCCHIHGPLVPISVIYRAFWGEQGKKSVTGIPFSPINQMFACFNPRNNQNENCITEKQACWHQDLPTKGRRLAVNGRKPGRDG